jgi:hypothetical protein
VDVKVGKYLHRRNPNGTWTTLLDEGGLSWSRIVYDDGEFKIRQVDPANLSIHGGNVETHDVSALPDHVVSDDPNHPSQ